MPTVNSRDDEFITIIGSDMSQITRAFREQGLSEQDFSMVHRAGRHRFTLVREGGSEDLFEGDTLVAATFARCHAS